MLAMNNKTINWYMRDLMSAGVKLEFTNQDYTMVYNEFDKFEILNGYGETVKQYINYTKAEEYIFNH